MDSRRAEVSVSGVRSGLISKEKSALEVSARFISSLAIWSAGEIVRASKSTFFKDKIKEKEEEEEEVLHVK